ncbi:MAG TPA: hypothetical protein VHE58_01175 [Burkholderiales bacterium]|nr:hypothetical protein [Burkholderiales bacterium]
MEREAYRIQSEFLVHYGVYQPVGLSLQPQAAKPWPTMNDPSPHRPPLIKLLTWRNIALK